MMPPGTTVKLKLTRDGNEKTLSFKLTEMPAETAKLKSDGEGGTKALEGVEVTNLNAEVAQELSLAPAKGVVVADVDPSSKIADSGLRRGDLIQEVNHQSVKKRL